MPEDDDQQYDRHDGPDDVLIEDVSSDHSADDPDEDPPAGSSAEEGQPGDEVDAEGADSTDGMPEPRPLSVVARNFATLGQLTLHYASRDVTVLLDGDAAMRLLTMFEQRREGGLADLLDPEMSEAEAGWVVLDLDEPLAMSWMPGLPRKRPRTAIDPAISVA